MKITLDILSEKASQELGLSKRTTRHIYKNLIKTFRYEEVANTADQCILVVGLGKFIIKNNAVRFKVSDYMRSKVVKRGIANDSFVGLASETVLKTMVKSKIKPYKTTAATTQTYKRVIDLFFQTVAQSIIDYDDVTIVGVGRIKVSPVQIKNNFCKGKDTVRVSFTPYRGLRKFK